MPPNWTLAMRMPCRSNASTTLPGIAKHISVSCSQNFIRDDRLAQRDPSIVWRNQDVQVNLEPIAPSSFHGADQQVLILERATAQTNALQLITLPDTAANFHDCGGEGVMKTRSDVSCRLRLAKVLHDVFDHWPHVHLRRLTLIHQKRIPLFAVRLRNHFQLDRSLPFKVDFLPQINEGGNGIEQSAAGR